jgi:hypothetical protein
MATNCPACGVEPHQWHRPSCRLEQCPYCGEHLLDCHCRESLPPLDDRMQWRGYYFWLEACLEFGFFEREIEGAWRPCRAEETASRPDYLRLVRECYWHRGRKRFERRKRCLS